MFPGLQVSRYSRHEMAFAWGSQRFFLIDNKAVMSPLTTHRSPITTHCSPITAHHSPPQLTTSHSTLLVVYHTPPPPPLTYLRNIFSSVPLQYLFKIMKGSKGIKRRRSTSIRNIIGNSKTRRAATAPFSVLSSPVSAQCPE